VPPYRGLATGSSRGIPRHVRIAAASVSALAHLLLIALAPILMRRDEFQPVSILQPPEADADAPLLISLFDAAPPPGPPPPPSERAAAPTAPPARAAVSTAPSARVPIIPATPGVGGDAVVAAPAAPPSSGAAPEGGGTIAERLRPGTMDSRLWSLAPEAAEFTPEQMAQLRILWAILDMSDSISAAEAAAREMTDWTFTDSKGGKWGISPGKIHLGDITLPFPSLSPPPSSGAAQRQWVDAQIERGAAAAAARANINERIKAIRERIDRERRGLPPDTASRRR
jgi:hypothetical protein